MHKGVRCSRCQRLQQAAREQRPSAHTVGRRRTVCVDQLDGALVSFGDNTEAAIPNLVLPVLRPVVYAERVAPEAMAQRRERPRQTMADVASKRRTARRAYLWPAADDCGGILNAKHSSMDRRLYSSSMAIGGADTR